MAKLFGGVLENARAGGQLADVDVAWNPMADGLLAAQKMALVFQERDLFMRFKACFKDILNVFQFKV